MFDIKINSILKSYEFNIFFLNVFYAFINFFVYFIMLKYIKPEVFGYYSKFFYLSTILTPIFYLCLDKSFFYKITNYKEDNLIKIYEYEKSILSNCIILSLIFLILSYFLSNYLLFFATLYLLTNSLIFFYSQIYLFKKNFNYFFVFVHLNLSLYILVLLIFQITYANSFYFLIYGKLLLSTLFFFFLIFKEKIYKRYNLVSLKYLYNLYKKNITLILSTTAENTFYFISFFFIPLTYTLEIFGYYSISYLLLRRPLSILVSTIYKINLFLGFKNYKYYILYLIFYSLFFLLLIGTINYIMSFFNFSKWEKIENYIYIISISVFFQSFFSSFDSLFIKLNKNFEKLAIDLFFVLIVISLFILNYFFFNLEFFSLLKLVVTIEVLYSISKYLYIHKAISI
jgi:O-antigen/teichoic acid export membrane protein